MPSRPGIWLALLWNTVAMLIQKGDWDCEYSAPRLLCEYVWGYPQERGKREKKRKMQIERQSRKLGRGKLWLEKPRGKRKGRAACRAVSCSGAAQEDSRAPLPHFSVRPPCSPCWDLWSWQWVNSQARGVGLVSDCQKLSQGISPRSLLQEVSLTLKAHGHEMSWILVSKLRGSEHDHRKSGCCTPTGKPPSVPSGWPSLLPGPFFFTV